MKFKITLLSLLLFSLTISSTFCNLFRIPFNPKITPNFPLNTINFLALPSPGSISNFQGQYKIPVRLGSHKNEFNVVLSTRSSDFWIPDSSTPASVSSKFDCSKSETCQADKSTNITLASPSGNVTGYFATDKLILGSLTLPKYSLLLAQDISSNLISSNGILGLGLKRTNPNIPTFLEVLQAEKLIDQQVFSVYLSDPNQVQTGSLAGEIIFGGYDPKYAKDPFKFITYKDDPLSPFNIVNLQALGYGYNANISEVSNIPIIFDIGTPYIFLPKAFISNFVQQAATKTSLTFDQEKGLYKCSCAAKRLFQDLVFYLDGFNLTISPNSYISTSGAACYLNMKSLGKDVSSTEPAVIGGLLFQEYYTIFSAENKTIGFTKMQAFSPPLSMMNVILIIFVGAAVIIGAVCFFTREKGLQVGFTRHRDEGIAIGGATGGRNYAKMEDNQEPAVL